MEMELKNLQWVAIVKNRSRPATLQIVSHSNISVLIGKRPIIWSVPLNCIAFYVYLVTFVSVRASVRACCFFFYSSLIFTWWYFDYCCLCTISIPMMWFNYLACVSFDDICWKSNASRFIIVVQHCSYIKKLQMKSVNSSMKWEGKKKNSK